ITDTHQVHIYDGNLKTIVASLNHEETGLIYSPGSSFVDAGEYKVQISAAETTNYFEASKEVTLTIQKADQEGIYLEDAEYVYTGEERYLSVSGIVPEIEDDIEITYENNGHVDAGIYDVVGTIKRPNYEDLV